VLGQEPVNLDPQLIVPSAGAAQPGLPFGGVGPGRSLEQLADPSTALWRHPSHPQDHKLSKRKVRMNPWHGHLARDIADTGWKPVPRTSRRIDQHKLSKRKVRMNPWHGHLASDIADTGSKPVPRTSRTIH
jgi:hypothetical protein